MTTVLLVTLQFNGCCRFNEKGPDGLKNHKKNECMQQTALIFDAIIFISTLVLGILGATAVIHMSPAASYALIGISSVIGLPWLLVFALAAVLHCIK